MIQLEDVGFTYQGSTSGGEVRNLNLTIKKGEFIVLCGRSGCGKTTVTRILNGLVPHFYEGDIQGSVSVGGLNVLKETLASISRTVGSVFQNPRSQFFNVDTTGEMAFGCENQGMRREDIRERIREAQQALSLEKLMGRSIFELSGGEKQQIACGSVYAAHPEVLVLDEPSSNLDAEAIARLYEILKKLKEQGKTVIISEHRIYYLMDIADCFYYIDQGQIIRTYTPEELRRLSAGKLDELGLRCTSLERAEVKVRARQSGGHAPPVLKITDLSFKRNKTQILQVNNLELPLKSVIALVGENGAGKSTLAGCLCGILKCRGQVEVEGKRMSAGERTKMSYMVMQDVNHQLFCSSVKEEAAMGLEEEDIPEVENVLEKLELSGYAERHPASLSGGQKQRVAICAALCAKKKILFYDEPTSGLDYSGMRRLCELIQGSRERLLLSMVITHDLELILGCCTHVLQLDKGKVKASYPLDDAGIKKVKSLFMKGGASLV